MKAEVKQNRGFIAIVILATVAIVVFLFIFVYMKRGEGKVPVANNNPPAPKTFGDLVQVVDTAQMPGNLPKDLPVEKDVQILKNEMVYFSNTGEIHSVRSYYSGKEIGVVFSDFKKYFVSQKWEVISAIDDPNAKFLLARKKDVSGTLQVNISKNQIDGKILVEIIKVEKNSTTVAPPPTLPKN